MSVYAMHAGTYVTLFIVSQLNEYGKIDEFHHKKIVLNVLLWFY